MEVRWSPFVKQVITIVGLAVLFWVLGRVHVMLIPVILALLLSYLVSFPVGWIMRHTGWPRWAVVAILYLLVILILITAPVLLMPRLMALFGSLGFTLRNIFVELSQTTPRPLQLTPTLTIDLGPFYAPLNQWLTSIIQADPSSAQSWQSLLFPFTRSAVVVVRGAVTSLIWTIFILTISFYVAKDAPVMGRFLASRLPVKLAPEMKHLWRELTLIWDAFVRGQILLGMTMGVLVWIVMSFLGVRNSAALGLLAGVFEFVPGIGPPLAAMAGILIALVLGSSWLPLAHLWFAVLVALTYFLLSQVENLYLLPRIVGRRISLHPAVVIAGALAGAQLGGVLGILLAAPTLGSLRVIFAYAMHKLLDEEPFPPATPGPQPDSYWRSLLYDRPVTAIVVDLDGTLVEMDHGAVANLAGRLAVLRRILPQFRPELAARNLLMISDGLVTEIMRLMAQLGMKRWLWRFSASLDWARGYCPASAFVPVPGSLVSLHGLAGYYPIALVTSRSASDAAAYVKQFGLADVFYTLVTRDDVRPLRPQPASVLLAARQLGIKAAGCVVVGDTPGDLRAARAAGALAVGVLSGLGGAENMCSADLVIDSVASLERYLRPSVELAVEKWAEINPLPAPPDLVE